MTRVIARNIREETPIYLLNDYLKELEVCITKVTPSDGETATIFLDNTIFYPGGGHQPRDEGLIIINGNELEIVDIEKRGSEIGYRVKIRDKNIDISEGDKAKLVIDWKRRYKIMKLHTAEHIFMEFIRGEGYELENGQWGAREGYITFNKEVPLRILFQSEEKTNEIIRMNLPVYRVINDSKIEIKIGEFSCRPCGGTHVRSTGEIEFFKIIRVLKNGKTIYFNVGWDAVKAVLGGFNKIIELSYDKFGLRQENSIEKFIESINHNYDELKSLRDQNEKLSDIIFNLIMRMPSRTLSIGELELEKKFIDLSGIGIQARYLRRLGRLISDQDNLLIIIRVSQDAVILLYKRSKQLHKKLMKLLMEFFGEDKEGLIISSIHGGLLIKANKNMIDELLMFIK